MIITGYGGYFFENLGQVVGQNAPVRLTADGKVLPALPKAPGVRVRVSPVIEDAMRRESAPERALENIRRLEAQAVRETRARAAALQGPPRHDPIPVLPRTQYFGEEELPAALRDNIVQHRQVRVYGRRYR